MASLNISKDGYKINPLGSAVGRSRMHLPSASLDMQQMRAGTANTGQADRLNPLFRQTHSTIETQEAVTIDALNVTHNEPFN